MNHTERIVFVSRQVRGLTREQVRQAVERYLKSAADDLASAQQVTLPGIGRLQIVFRPNSGRLRTNIHSSDLPLRKPGYRVQACLRLTDDLKAACHRFFDIVSPVSTRIEPGDRNTNRVQPGNNPDS